MSTISLVMAQDPALAAIKWEHNSACALYYAYAAKEINEEEFKEKLASMDSKNHFITAIGTDHKYVYSLLWEVSNQTNSETNHLSTLVEEMQQGYAPNANKKSVLAALRSMDKTQEGGICKTSNKTVNTPGCSARGGYCLKKVINVELMGKDDVVEYLIDKVNNESSDQDLY